VRGVRFVIEGSIPPDVSIKDFIILYLAIVQLIAESLLKADWHPQIFV